MAQQQQVLVTVTEIELRRLEQARGREEVRGEHPAFGFAVELQEAHQYPGAQGGLQFQAQDQLPHAR